MRRFPVVLASSLALVVALTGCSDSSTSSKASNTSATTTTGAAATTAPAASGSAATTTGPALPAGTELPTATGSFGDKPTLTFPKTTGAPTTVQTKVLHQGTGPVVAKNDLLVAAYLGQIWNGKVFDNSYDRKAPTGFTIGAGKVIPGWDSTLVGQKVGTRILVSIPPAAGLRRRPASLRPASPVRTPSSSSSTSSARTTRPPVLTPRARQPRCPRAPGSPSPAPSPVRRP